MYSIYVQPRGRITAAEIQRKLSDMKMTVPSEGHRQRMFHLGEIERICARGIIYANQDFDILSTALRFAENHKDDLIDQADMVRFHRYRITHHAAECDCQNCGAPLYVGDRYIAQADQSPAFCGRHCAENHTGLTVSISGFVTPVGR